MWRFKPFGHKEPSGLEGRTIDVGNLKIHVRNAIAEGGFSCVYLARDAFHMSKQYALKHMICNDEESLELVTREISVMKSLQGHPNVVTLHAHSILDMGRMKEAFLVMEFCEKSLVNVLESRGVGYFDEKQILSIFRDVCNAVFSMHCQSPPIAHRDLKVENLLLGPDGSWKLCDFGSTSTNHKRFEKPEEMGIEEDNIRKQTTPAYRAPEMWDLLRREFIGEKVDIWALGCLLFRICYFKNAFDGESKLQILNGNYRIPDLPKYSSSITDLIRDMLQESPHDRPDITQVWFRVNEQLPVGLQKSLPDRPPGIQSTETNDGISKSADKSPPMPRRSPPPVPSSAESTRNLSQVALSSSTGLGGGQLGAFWSTQHAKNSLFEEEKNRPKFDEEVTLHNKSEPNPIHSNNHILPKNPSYVRDESTHSRNTQIKTQKDFELTFPQKSPNDSSDRSKPGTMAFQDNTFNSFVAEFDTEKFISGVGDSKARKEAALEAEIEKLKEQLKQTNSEKAEITSKFEKLSAICRSQRHEIQELKQALATSTQNKEAAKNETPPMSQSSSTSLKEKEEGQGRFLDQQLQEEKPDWSASSKKEQKQWQAFAEEPKSHLPSFADKSVKSVRTRNSQQKKDQVNSGFDSWGFGSDSFTAVSASNFHVSKPMNEGNSSQRFGEAKIVENKPACQPAGWAGF